MAFSALHALVSTFQLEPRFVVIKPVGLPVAEVVALRAICFSVYAELGLVHVGVTGFAACRQGFKALFFRPVLQLPEMAIAARFLFVFAFQRKSGDRMIETYFFPAFHGMAALALPVRNEFVRHLILMNVFVTGNAACVGNHKSPLPGVFMAGKTRGCRMRAIQLKIRFVVLFDGEQCFLKPRFVVAVVAVRRRVLLCKLPLVVILMTVGTAGVFYRRGIVRFVALFTVEFLVFAHQSETGFAVVEIAFVFQGQERRLGMTFRAVLPESVFMNIFVTVGAGAKSNSGEPLKILVVFLFNGVAFDTGHIGVFAFQRKFGVLMLEFRCRLE